MQVSGQLEAPAALPPEETLIPIEQEIEWAAELHTGCFGEEHVSCTC